MDRQTDEIHEHHVYVGLAQAHPNWYSLIEQSTLLFVTAILESITNPGQSKLFELDPVIWMTRKKSDLSDPDMQIDPTPNFNPG